MENLPSTGDSPSTNHVHDYRGLFFLNTLHVPKTICSHDPRGLKDQAALPPGRVMQCITFGCPQAQHLYSSAVCDAAETAESPCLVQQKLILNNLAWRQVIFFRYCSYLHIANNLS